MVALNRLNFTSEFVDLNPMNRWIIGPSHTVGIVRSNFGFLYGVLRGLFSLYNLISVQQIFWLILIQKIK
jgi:hypothetical protein